MAKKTLAKKTLPLKPAAKPAKKASVVESQKKTAVRTSSLSTKPKPKKVIKKNIEIIDEKNKVFPDHSKNYGSGTIQKIPTSDEYETETDKTETLIISDPIADESIAEEWENTNELLNTPSSKAVSVKPLSSSTDPLTLYLNEIQRYPLLTREEEEKIAKEYYDTRNPDAAQQLVRANLRFVVKIAAEYSKFGARMIDLIQEGNVGLMHAVKEFNPYKGNKLITYAVWWIKGYIQEYLMRQYSMVRIGTTQNQRKLFYQLQKQKEALEKLGETPQIALLSEKLGIPEDEVSEMAKRMSGRDVSIDRPIDEDSGFSIKDLLKSESGEEPLDERMALAEQLEILKEKIESLRPELSEKEKIILDERLLSDDPLTLQEIGEKYKITREAVRQAEVRVLKKIKDRMGVKNDNPN